MSSLNNQLNNSEKGSRCEPFFTKVDPQKHCWIEISKKNFDNNASWLSQLIGPQRAIGAVVKSNAYGHGLPVVGQLCQDCPQISYLMVFLLSDAVMLRSQGVTKPILVLGGYDLPLEQAIVHDIDVAIYDQETLHDACRCVRELKQPLDIHLKIDTGLVRLGFLPEELPAVIAALQQLPLIAIKGIYSHFAESDNVTDLTFTNLQLTRFGQAITQCKEQGVAIPHVHLANTAATLRLPDTYWTMIRCGGALYGTYKKELFYQEAQNRIPGFNLQPLLTLKSCIMAIKEVLAGTPIGYGCTYTASHAMRLATVSIGYYDGLDRRLSNNGQVLLHNTIAPIIGRIGMNMMTIDITHIPQAQLHETVTIIGNHDGVRLRDMAQRLDTIEYDIMTRLSANVPRSVIT